MLYALKRFHSDEPTCVCRRFSIVKDSEYNIRIANVRELPGSISISRWELMRYSGGEISVTLKSKFTGGGDSNNVLTLMLGVTYSYMKGMMRHRLLHYSIAVDFEVGDAGRFSIDDGGMDIPPRLMTLMYGAAIGAMRGMLALRTAGTFLKDYPLPLINISALVCEHMSGRKVPDNIMPLTDLYYN